MNMNDFGAMVEKDFDGKETVSFNYPKYQALGTPHEIWKLNVSKVEEHLESIIENNPWQEDYPLMHMRREEETDDGLLIRVHFDLYGKTTLVNFAMQMLNKSVNMYVSLNTIASDKGKEILKSAPPELAELLKNPGALVDILKLPQGSVNSPDELKAKVSEMLKAKGIDPANVKLIGPEGVNLNIAEDSLTHLSEDDAPAGPLDFGKADEVDSGAKSEKFPFILMPNPAPDEIN